MTKLKLSERNQHLRRGRGYKAKPGPTPGSLARTTSHRVRKITEVSLVYKFKRKIPVAIRVTAPKEVLAGLDAYVNPFENFKGYGDLPLTPMSLERIYDTFSTDVKVDPDVLEWSRKEIALRRQMNDQFIQPSDVWVPEGHSLYSFQRQGVAFMCSSQFLQSNELGIKALQFDDPRLGKTIQSVVTVLIPENTPALIVCLKSLIEYWKQQIQIWAPSVEPVILEGSVSERLEQLQDVVASDRPSVMITNWETLRKVKEVPRRIRNKIITVIGDEAHVVRNRKTKVAEGLHTLRPQNAILLTATPLERGPQEYFSYLKFLRPAEFSSYWQFVFWFCRTEFNGFGQEIVGTRNTKLLKDLLYPMILRRRAEDVANIPPKVFETIPIKTTPKFNDLYDGIRDDTLRELFPDDDDKYGLELHPNALSIMTRLRQMSVDPMLLGFDEPSPKLETLTELIDVRFPNDKIVVFCSFNLVLETLQKVLGEQAVFFSGDLREVQDFYSDESKVRVFLTTVQKGGVGQNLGASSIIIYYDLPLSSTLLRQSMERTTLIGKSETQLIISLAATPMDWTIASLLDSKLDSISDVDILTQVIAAELDAHYETKEEVDK